MGGGTSTGFTYDLADEAPEIVRPTFMIYAENVPEAFESAMRKVWFDGARIATQYDKEGDPLSRDAKVVIQIANPFNQPRFHKAFVDGLGGLGEYVEEVVSGAHDYWMPPLDVRLKEARSGEKRVDTKWFYTYHERLRNYPGTSWEFIDQIENMAQNLAASPHTRRAQAITYVPWIDQLIDDPPCLQRVWARVFEGPDGNRYLHMDTDWRSRDLFKAWFENVIALTTLHRGIVDRVNEIRRGPEPILIGPYTDHCNSLHIYGADFSEIEGNEDKGVKNFFDNIDSRSFEDMTWGSEFVREFFLDDGTGKGLEIMLKREKDMPDEVKAKIAAKIEKLRDPSFIV